MLFFFTNVSLMEFQVRYLALFILFSATNSRGWFLMGNQALILDLLCIQQLDAAPSCENCAKLYFDAKHLEKRLSREWWNFWCLFFKKKCPFWPISDPALIFEIRPWNLHKNIQLMLEFLKAPFLVPHFSNYTLMTFLLMLFVILLSMLMILRSTLNMIRYLICCNN